MHAYLTTAEVAALTGRSRHTVARRIEAHELPTLHLGPHSRRIEARAVVTHAPETCLAGRSWTLCELARWWRVHPRTLTGTSLMAELRHGRINRARLLRWVQNHTTGPDAP